MVEDLLELWEGGINVYSSGKNVTIYAALLCITCGFLSHSASRGCSKCMKVFKYDKERKKIGFDPCIPRCHAQPHYG